MRGAWWMVPGLLLFALPGGFVVPAGARADACPTHVETTYEGEQDAGARRRVTRRPAKDEYASHVLIHRCTGARGRPLLVRPGIKDRVRLPPVPGGTTVADVAVTGDGVAWRTWSARGSGRLFVGRLRGTRVRDLRALPVRVLPRTRALQGTTVVTPEAVAAWSLPGRGGVGRVWSWEPGRRPRAVTPPARGVVLTLVDDQYVRIATRRTPTGRLRALRATPPDRCPRAVPSDVEPAAEGSEDDLGGWCVGFEDSVTEDAGATGGSWSTTYTIFVPPARRVLATVQTGGSNSQYHSEGTRLRGMWRVGSSLVTTLLHFGMSYGSEYVSEIVNTADGQRESPPGAVVGTSGQVPTIERFGTGLPPDRLSPVGAVTVPGVLAWLGGVGARQVTLHDAAGTRVVGTVDPSAPGSLRIEQGRLRWPGGSPDGLPVTPAVDEPYAEQID